MTGLVNNIQKYSVHDGGGIRTVVFFQGCPLRCRWCSNPETQPLANPRLYWRNKCIGCGICTTRCGFDAIRLHRERPECSTMVRSEDKMKAILPYMLKRAVKIKLKGKKG